MDIYIYSQREEVGFTVKYSSFVIISFTINQEDPDIQNKRDVQYFNHLNVMLIIFTTVAHS